MREYLVKTDNGSYLYTKNVSDIAAERVIEIPEGAEKATICGDYLIFWKLGYLSFSIKEEGDWVDAIKYQNRYFKFDEYMKGHSEAIIVWQRHTQPEELPFVDSINDQYAEIEQVRKHRHYFKDVSNIAEIDVYAVLKLFDVTDPCLQHIVKKALCAGKRGHKDMMEDLQNIVDTAIRAVELNS